LLYIETQIFGNGFRNSLVYFSMMTSVPVTM